MWVTTRDMQKRKAEI